ncbi:DUF2574 domain-containing protein, partial [Salmonella enterica subsp. enterica serovar Ohio]|nr:DUF2574 domain-containing protein [Salmonella enterica subsp. enterica serovar Ohio]
MVLAGMLIHNSTEKWLVRCFPLKTGIMNTMKKSLFLGFITLAYG